MNSLPPVTEPGSDSFVESLMDTNLYSIGAFFNHRHPELVEVGGGRGRGDRARQGSRPTRTRGGARGSRPAFQTLVTGLAVRYYRAV